MTDAHRMYFGKWMRGLCNLVVMLMGLLLPAGTVLRAGGILYEHNVQRGVPTPRVPHVP